MEPITKSFLEQDTLKMARALLGCHLVSKTKKGEVVGKITETEAYLSNDPASHSFNGKTKRNSAMFDSPGKAYVYFTYGMYHCFNVVTAKRGVGEAVLIRALEPIKGIELMKKRRNQDNLKELCNGPAKLVQAMGITKEHNGISLLKGNLMLFKGEKIAKNQIQKTKRIGISKGVNLPYRFSIKDKN